MSEYKREKIIQYKIQYKPSGENDWKDLYTNSYSYWQAETIVLYYTEYKGINVQSVPVEISE